jgi:Cft2 family RNA processing exonuclease
MKSTITFFPVDNGDMTLIKLSDGTTILIDINLRESAEDEEDPSFDAVKGLRDRLGNDNDGRPYVDAFLLTHPDQDHCRGLRKHFHLGPLSNYNFSPPEGEELKIVMRELWSSPMIFRRASKNNPLCEYLSIPFGYQPAGKPSISLTDCFFIKFQTFLSFLRLD